MNRSLCHLVPACALALASGCFLGHGRDEADPARDAGPMPGFDAGSDPPPLVDAGRRPDPPPDDPPPPDPPPTMCDAARADATCRGPFLFEPGIPFELPISFDECGCCPEPECTVAIDHVEQRIALRTALCADVCDCTDCVPVEGTCAIPALAAGSWTVDVNAGEAFELVVETGPFVEPPPACVTYAQPDTCPPSDPLGGEPLVPDEVCVVPGGIGGPRIELIEDCPSCWLLDGPCLVEVEPRSTDDLPPGGEIRVWPRKYPTGCDVACTAECTQTTRSCAVPPLAVGDYYRVWIDGEVVLSFVEGAGGRLCSR